MWRPGSNEWQAMHRRATRAPRSGSPAARTGAAKARSAAKVTRVARREGCGLMGLLLSGSSARVDADEQCRVSDVVVRGHLEVARRGYVLEDAPREIEPRSMAGAIEAAWPRRADVGGAALRPERRDAAQVRADRHQHGEVGLDGAQLVARVAGLLLQPARTRIAELLIVC